jgi:hypothetical protein
MSGAMMEECDCTDNLHAKVIDEEPAAEGETI